VASRCVWSRNLENGEAKARYRAVKIQPQWVVTPGKQTNKQTFAISGFHPALLESITFIVRLMHSIIQNLEVVFMTALHAYSYILEVEIYVV